MSGKNKKPAKHPIDWQQTVVSVIADLIVGTLLILISKLFE